MQFRIIILFLLFSASILAQPQIGKWEGKLDLKEKTDSANLPVHFEINLINGKYSAVFLNAEEQIEADEVLIRNDSIFIKMPVFDSEFRCLIVDEYTLNGIWINHARTNKNIIPFVAYGPRKGKRCGVGHSNTQNDISMFSGKWECFFMEDISKPTKALGVFAVDNSDPYNSKATGTFLTETGDYRFLQGGVFPYKDILILSLSTFDGAHAFMFRGEIKGDSIVNGHFYSGSHWHEPWVAVRNDKFELRNPDSLTYLKPGYDKIDFSFKNLEGKTVSLSDEKFKNKVVIVQIMGSWCPNCMDETKYLSSVYDKNKIKGLEIVAVAYEKTDDFAKAINNVSRLKNRFNVNYEFLISGETGKEKASESFPMLNEIIAFPTTIFIDKKGKIRKIYTGFSGPGTGKYYDKFVEETDLFLEKLLKE